MTDEPANEAISEETIDSTEEVVPSVVMTLAVVELNTLSDDESEDKKVVVEGLSCGGHPVGMEPILKS